MVFDPSPMAIDREAAERAIEAFLRALGFDPAENPELQDTPARVTEAYSQDLLSGYRVDVAKLIAEGSSPNSSLDGGPIVMTGIAVATVCPHHLLPALGTASIVYLPGPRLLGLGTLAGLVDAYARRLTFQEQIGENVVRALIELLAARGAYCELTLTHACLSARGERQAQAVLSTSARAGALARPEAVHEISLGLQRARGAP
jgi:GTP cyclohydrolase IA